MGRKNHDCQAFVKKVMMYLDNELPKNTQRDLLVEIKQCPTCFKRLSQEKSFKQFIRNRVHRRKVSPSLVQSIKDKIRLTTV